MIECVLQLDSLLGESPLWDPQENLLYWVDILGQKIHRLDPESKQHTEFQLPEIVTSIALRKETKKELLITLRKQIAFFDLETSQITQVAEVEKDLPDNCFNDGKCDRFGRFWAGSINRAHFEKPTGVLYSLHSNGKVVSIEGNGVCFNGIGWSPDNRTMYIVQSFLYTIFAYDFDSVKGTISHKRPFISFREKGGGFPDGLTVDFEGYVWVALSGLGLLLRIDPSGEIEKKIQFPVPRITSCAFGGKDLGTLYVTSAREMMTSLELQKYPLSGSLFSFRPGVQGLKEGSF